jgi:hypothetical protein
LHGVHSTLVTPSKQEDESFANIKDDDNVPCGEYCPRLYPNRQKDIIKNVMKKEYGQDLKIFANKADAGFPNERKYILDAKWWRKWCDYTGFEVMEQAQ